MNGIEMLSRRVSELEKRTITNLETGDIIGIVRDNQDVINIIDDN